MKGRVYFLCLCIQSSTLGEERRVTALVEGGRVLDVDAVCRVHDHVT